jgi:hypothetical protein
VPADAPVTGRTVLETWWPLAASWIFMSLELPVVSAVIARLPNPEVNLAAYGGIVFPISLLVEAPIIMMLAASTAVSKNWDSFVKLRRFMFVLAFVLAALHAAIAFTPLYDVVVGGWLEPPEALREPGRLGPMIMTPWSFAIAIRRFYQGVLIRYGESRLVGVGTAIRLAANMATLAIGLWLGSTRGIVVGTSAVIAGVLAELLFVLWKVRPVLRGPLRDARDDGVPHSTPTLIAFYLPLAVTPVLTLFAQPIVSAALSRMPRPIESLAVLPVLNGVAFGLRSLGIAFQEVVVALMDRPGAARELPRFARRLALVATTLIVLFAATPLARTWFSTISGLSAGLATLALTAIWIYVPSPAMSVAQSWYQGVLVGSRETRSVTESVAVYLAVTATALAIGTFMLSVTGIYVSAIAVTLGNASLAGWLMMRSRRARRRMSETAR